MDVPSGRKFSALDIEIVRLIGKYRFVRREEEPIRLVSGITSHVYVSGRESLTDHPDFEWLVGRKIAETIWKSFSYDTLPKCLIGIPVAGAALAQAAAMYTHDVPLMSFRSICHRTMRQIKKEHGTHHTWVDGAPDPMHYSYGAIDNTATNGGSKVKARTRLLEDGYPVNDMFWMIFVDRGQGAVPRLATLGFTNLIVVYILLDIVYAFGELGLWPKEHVKAVKEEMAVFQFP
ncbi:MAG: hypothetical protein A2122_00025 [Candidatus Liptonbacteria bacterium GWB1_49_6]|uniref:Phosphoribosyltransferase domain-containing protein n=1 Tax=Candidatus Liptonbacteria bacterium GWB1_49_6 TaxID=1798644 RepID=A0A1G2C873_9BACT|nr:MAG: hypothetical protein A2122_00025 [Candidatus Liptonbacteria bacterium GWB1_49_6]